MCGKSRQKAQGSSREDWVFGPQTPVSVASSESTAGPQYSPDPRLAWCFLTWSDDWDGDETEERNSLHGYHIS